MRWARALGGVLVVVVAVALVSWWLGQRDRKRAIVAAQREKQRQALELERLQVQVRDEQRQHEADMLRLRGPERPALLPEWGERAHACRSNDDCVLTRIADGGHCCLGCGVRAYAKPFVTALEKQLARACEKTPCQIHSICSPHGKTARCENGGCTTAGSKPERRPAKCQCPPGDPLCSCP